MAPFSVGSRKYGDGDCVCVWGGGGWLFTNAGKAPPTPQVFIIFILICIFNRYGSSRVARSCRAGLINASLAVADRL